MPLCFIEPQDAIRVIAESVGREARRQLLGERVRAWVDEIPEEELRLALRQGRGRFRRARPVDARGLARLDGGRHADREQGLPRQRVPDLGGEPARGAEDRRRPARRGRVQRRRWPRSRRWRRYCRGSPATAARTGGPNASSSTAGTGSAQTTEARASRRARGSGAAGVAVNPPRERVRVAERRAPAYAGAERIQYSARPGNGQHDPSAPAGSKPKRG